MLLQVHDELVFETPAEEAEATSALVQRVMAQAPTPAALLSVPLDVEAKWGTNWAKAH
jgi:DNA polymerase-1